MQIEQIGLSELEQRAEELKLTLPIEQTHQWASYQATIEGRSPWRCVRFADDDRTLALASLMDFETHGYHFLRSEHGPVWVEGPSEALEAQAITTLCDYVRSEHRAAAFIRMAVKHALDVTRPTLSTIPYDRTVILDVTGGDEAILLRMKPRGRRDVRKALRESPIECADETERASASFEEYYPLMVETGERDGFTPAPMSDYENMMHILGTGHCRLYAGRLDGRLTNWSMVTVSGKRATRYYAASSTDTMRMHVGDKLVYFEACELGRLFDGTVSEYDLMAIGSDLSPELNGLNEFKCKFSKEVAEVAPDRDVPLRKTLYAALVAARRALRRG